MNIIIYKKSIFIKAIFTLLIIILLCSCTNKSQQEIASTDIVKNAESQNGSMYIVNKRSGKVHSRTHGSEIIQNKDNILEIADSLENILKNENYDICRTCFAGLRNNLKNYRDYDFDLIEKFMRLYEFGNLDTETQKFLICIFEVGEWYVDNVYTYQGGLQNVVETENIAKASASDMAYTRWQNYLKSYSSLFPFRDDSRILPTAYNEFNKPSSLVTYTCDLLKNTNYPKGNTYDLMTPDNKIIAKNEYKNNCVIDDCSKFAAAVYYYYLNKELAKPNLASKIDLWWTSSSMFSDYTNLTDCIAQTEKFALIKIKNLEKIQSKNGVIIYYKNYKLNLKPGDLLYRNGHVEFYIGNNKVIGWGRIHKEYSLKKVFQPKLDGYHSNYPKDNDIPYTTIIRFKGGNN